MAAYDLAALWEAHCRYEFETRDVDATMSTMVAEPYVNHIPTSVFAFRAEHRPESFSDAMIADLFPRGSRHTLRREIRGLTGHILGTPAHKPGQSQRTTANVISQVRTGLRLRPGSV
jgi:hypothetical protein